MNNSQSKIKSAFTFRHADRLHGREAFAQVFDAKLRKHVGPLTVFSLPNTAGRHRLGLSVSRKVGNAIRRSKAKRLVREAFRLKRDQWAGAYDLVVVVRPHESLPLGEYERMLTLAVEGAHRGWQKRTD